MKLNLLRLQDCGFTVQLTEDANGKLSYLDINPRHDSPDGTTPWIRTIEKHLTKMEYLTDSDIDLLVHDFSVAITDAQIMTIIKG